MAKKKVKQAIHKESRASRDTFWNRERIKRGITYTEISERYKRSLSTICCWFIGKKVPQDETIIRDLCKWFSDTPYTDGSDSIITYERGMYEFEEAHKDYSAKKTGKTINLRSEPKTDVVEYEKNINDTIVIQQVNSIHFLLRHRHITYKQLASELKCTVTMIRHWIRGYDMPNDVYIGKMADILEYDPDKLTDLFRMEYDKQYNVEGQIDISEAIEDAAKEPEPEVKFSPEVEDALKKMADHHDDHERFVKWFNFLSSISPARISDKDVANIMTEYVNCNYCMYEAMEAWHNEYHPNYVHERYILLICDRKGWFGEDYETGTWLIEGL